MKIRKNKQQLHRYKALLPWPLQWMGAVVDLAWTVLGLLICSFFIADFLFPHPNLVNGQFVPLERYSTLVRSHDGVPLRHFADNKGVFRYAITAKQVSPFYLKALFAYEDRYFYQHPGINPLSVGRALGQWLTHGKVISGGSTISMQVARILTPHERTILGKATQMFRTIQLERALSKDEILSLYLTYAPMGGNIEGVEAASRRYFNKPAIALNDAEASLLAVLPQRPTSYRPDRFYQRAIEARNKVIERLQSQGEISTKNAQSLLHEKLSLNRGESPFLAPLLARDLHMMYPDRALIDTTIDSAIQLRVEALVKNQANLWDPRASAAVLVVHNPSHEIRGWVGSADIFNAQRFGYIDMTQALRSPGSTLKPFIYAMAIDKALIHSASLISDSHQKFDQYAPANFNSHFYGNVTAMSALQASLNIPVVVVLQALGAEQFEHLIRATGALLVHKETNLSIALGGTGTNLHSLVQLYSAFANKGLVYPLKVQPDTHQARGIPLFSEGAGWIVWDALNHVRRPTGINTTRPIGWKTGTSYGYRDAWAIGVSGDWTVGVWVGRPDGAPHQNAYGITYAAPLMFRIFDALPKDQHPIHRPDTVVDKLICWPQGRAVTQTKPEACEQKFEAKTLNGWTPPTLPSQLARFQPNQPTADDIQRQQRIDLKITSLKAGSHLFRQPGIFIPLKSSCLNPCPRKLNWYLDGQLLTQPRLNLDKIRDNSAIVSVSDEFGNSDSVTIYLH